MANSFAPESRVVPTNYSTAWIGASTQLLKVNYPLILGVTFIFVTSAILANVAWIGIGLGFLLNALRTLLGPGLLFIVADFLKLEKSAFVKLFVVFQDKDLFSRILPLVAFNCVFSFILSLFPPGFSLVTGLLAVVASFFTYFSTPLITFHRMRFVDTLLPTYHAMLKNIVPLVAVSVLLLILSTGLIILLLAPFFFYGAPLLFVISYPIYASIFLGLDAVALHEELKAKLAVPPSIG